MSGIVRFGVLITNGDGVIWRGQGGVIRAPKTEIGVIRRWACTLGIRKQVGFFSPAFTGQKDIGKVRRQRMCGRSDDSERDLWTIRAEGVPVLPCARAAGVNVQESKFLCSVKKGGRETTRVEMNTHVRSKGNAFALRLVWCVVLKNWSTKLSTTRSEGSGKRGKMSGRARWDGRGPVEPAHFRREGRGRNRRWVTDEDTGARVNINFTRREIRREIRK